VINYVFCIYNYRNTVSVPLLCAILQQHVFALRCKNFVSQQGYKFYHIYGHLTSSVTWL